MKITKSRTARLSGTTITVAELRELLDDILGDAVVHIDYTDFSGSRDPRENSYVTLRVDES